jgi:hypothetical protein
MARSDRIFSFIWIALGVFQCAESCFLGLGSFMEPGTGFMTFVMGLVMTALAIALFLDSHFGMRKKPFPKGSLWLDVYWKKVVYITVNRCDVPDHRGPSDSVSKQSTLRGRH